MNKSFLIIFLTVVVISSLIFVGVLLLYVPHDQAAKGKLYSFPISVAEETYVVRVESNYTSSPEVSYNIFGKSVSIDFRGDPENAFCNATIPSDLIWGEFHYMQNIMKWMIIPIQNQLIAHIIQSILCSIKLLLLNTLK